MKSNRKYRNSSYDKSTKIHLWWESTSFYILLFAKTKTKKNNSKGVLAQYWTSSQDMVFTIPAMIAVSVIKRPNLSWMKKILSEVTVHGKMCVR